jgi:hypothetical protein
MLGRMTQNNEKYTTGYANAIISKFMDFGVVDVGYADSEEETEWQRNHEEWMIKVGLTQVGRYIVNVKENIWHCWDDVKYHSSWDWLMLVVEKISSLDGGKYNFHISSTGQWACYINRDDVFDSEITSYGGFEPMIINVWKAVYKFIQWYNNQSTTTNDTTTGND